MNIPTHLTVNDWMSLNYPLLQTACQRMTGMDPLHEDLCQEVVTIFLTHKDALAIVTEGAAFFYCLRIAMNLWRSQTSPFYKQFKHEHVRLDTEHENIAEIELDLEAWHTEIDRILDTELSWYETRLLQEYVDANCNALALSRLTGIPRTSIGLTIKRIKMHLRDKMSSI